MGVGQSLSLFNATVRTLLATVVVGGLGLGGWYGYNEYNKKELTAKALEEAQKELAAKNEEIARLGTAMRMLKFSRRLGQARALAVWEDDTTGQRKATIEFIEVSEDGEQIGKRRVFEIQGDELYIDCFVVSFEDKYIEQAIDLERSKPMCIFLRAFGNLETPEEGYKLANETGPPSSYGRTGEVSNLEKKIFTDFWAVANDRVQQEELGIRAALGKAPHMKLIEGKTYQIKLRATGELTLVPDKEMIPVVSGPAA